MREGLRVESLHPPQPGCHDGVAVKREVVIQVLVLGERPKPHYVNKRIHEDRPNVVDVLHREDEL